MDYLTYWVYGKRSAVPKGTAVSTFIGKNLESKHMSCAFASQNASVMRLKLSNLYEIYKMKNEMHKKHVLN